MNKKTIKIAGWALGLSMAVAGIGVAVGATVGGNSAPVMTNAAETEVLSWSRSGTTDTYTSGKTFSATANAKTGYYQDNSGTTGLKLYDDKANLWSTAPKSVTFHASIGGGTGNKDLSNNVYVCLVDSSGSFIAGTETLVTDHITTAGGDDYDITFSSRPEAAAGVYVYHAKESGYNVRYFSFSLSFEAGSATAPSVTITNASISGKVGDTVKLTCTTKNTESFTSENVVWSVPNDSIATIEGDTLTFVKNGDDIDVTATLRDGETVKDSKSMRTSLAVPSVTITGTGVSNGSIKLPVDGTVTLSKSYENQPTSGYSYVWSHSGTAGSFNSSTGLYTAGSDAGEDTVSVQMKYGETVIAQDSITIKVTKEFTPSIGEYHKVTNLNQLYDGANIALVNADADYSMLSGFDTSKNNVTATAITADGNTGTITKQNVLNITLVKTAANTYRFKIDDDLYLYAASSSSNNLKANTLATSGDNGKFLIGLSDDVFTITAQGNYTRNTLRFNPNNGSPIFSCYASSSTTGTTAAIYVFETHKDEAIEFAKQFNSSVGGLCDAGGDTSSANVDSIKSKWASLATAYGKLTDGCKDYFATEESHTQNDIQRFIGMYEMIVKKYGQSNFMTDSSDSEIFPEFGASVVNTVQGESSTFNRNAILLTAVVTTGFMAAAGLMFIRHRRREEE